MSQADSTNTTGASGVGGEGLYLPTDISPEEVFQAIGRLRKEARDEINRLIQFLDETDNHMEREPDGDELDASYPESGSRMCTPGEDDEDTADAEPSLGSSGHASGGAISYLSHAISDGCEMVYDCEGDEHDGREPEGEDDPHDGREPDREGRPCLPGSDRPDSHAVRPAGLRRDRRCAMTVETVSEILACLDNGRFIPANVDVGLAITAYQLAAMRGRLAGGHSGPDA